MSSPERGSLPQDADGPDLGRRVSQPRDRAAVIRRLRRATGVISTYTMRRIEHEFDWFAALSAQERAWIASIVQGGLASFVDWYAEDERTPPALVQEVFGAAPSTFAGTISLRRTVDMTRVAIAELEDSLPRLLGPQDAAPVTVSVTRYGRELGFAIAAVYARAAELRGAWDARLEALVVDAVIRGDADETVASRASALGWPTEGRCLVMVGSLSGPDPGSGSGRSEDAAIEEVRQAAHDAGLRALCAVQGERLVVLLGRLEDDPPLARLADRFGEGPVVVGPEVADLADARRSAAAAFAGHRAAAGWPHAPRPVLADDLLPERVLSGDPGAAEQLRTRVHEPLRHAGVGVLDTVQAYLDRGGALEATARALFVHPNTVRYRLRKATEATGLDPTDPREGYLVRVALSVGNLSAPTAPGTRGRLPDEL